MLWSGTALRTFVASLTLLVLLVIGGHGSPQVRALSNQANLMSSNLLRLGDGTTLYFKNWNTYPSLPQTIVFSHGWPLTADAWDAQMLFFGQLGYRVVAHDRRGHGRSSQTWTGNDIDTYADDLFALIEALDLNNVVLIGHSTGGGEVIRYISRHGSTRVAQVVLLASVTPLMLQTPGNPGGLPISVFDAIREGVVTDRVQFFKNLSLSFYGANRAGSVVSQGVLDKFWLQGLQGGIKSEYDCIKAFSETDFTEDLKKLDKPTFILHGDDDQIVPYQDAALLAAKLVKDNTLKIYPGYPHGMAEIHADQINNDILAFIKSH